MKLEKYLSIIACLLWGGSLVFYYDAYFSEAEKFIKATIHYIEILWILWFFIVGMSIYTKWKQQNNFLFYILYLLYSMSILLVIVLYFRAPEGVNSGTFTGWELQLLLRVLIIPILSLILQGAVHWFTQHDHRKM